MIMLDIVIVYIRTVSKCSTQDLGVQYVSYKHTDRDVHALMVMCQLNQTAFKRNPVQKMSLERIIPVLNKRSPLPKD